MFLRRLSRGHPLRYRACVRAARRRKHTPAPVLPRPVRATSASPASETAVPHRPSPRMRCRRLGR
eukprot:8251205-Pyramimonas_sp.AAC.1